MKHRIFFSSFFSPTFLCIIQKQEDCKNWELRNIGACTREIVHEYTDKTKIRVNFTLISTSGALHQDIYNSYRKRKRKRIQTIHYSQISQLLTDHDLFNEKTGKGHNKSLFFSHFLENKSASLLQKSNHLHQFHMKRLTKRSKS